VAAVLLAPAAVVVVGASVVVVGAAVVVVVAGRVVVVVEVRAGDDVVTDVSRTVLMESESLPPLANAAMPTITTITSAGIAIFDHSGSALTHATKPDDAGRRLIQSPLSQRTHARVPRERYAHWDRVSITWCPSTTERAH
jgi:hypothetical protein